MMEGLLANKSVLVVEDNSINQLLVQHTLLRYHTNVTIAEDGKKAVELLHKNTYDFVLMDLQLPDMSGYEVVQVMRKNLKLEVPVFALTALALEGERDNCIAAGMNGYIIKPFTAKKLEEEINRSIECTDANNHLSEYIIGDEATCIDLEFLYTVAANDFDYIQLMIKIFTDTLPPLIQKMREQYVHKQWAELQKTAHYVKSSLSVIKVKQMIILVASIEWQCKTQTSLHEIDEKIDKLEDQFTRSEQFLLKIPLNVQNVPL